MGEAGCCSGTWDMRHSVGEDGCCFGTQESTVAVPQGGERCRFSLLERTISRGKDDSFFSSVVEIYSAGGEGCCFCP